MRSEKRWHIWEKRMDILNMVSAGRYRKHSTRRDAFKIRISEMTACLTWQTWWKITLSGYWKDVRRISNMNKENYALKKKTQRQTLSSDKAKETKGQWESLPQGNKTESNTGRLLEISCGLHINIQGHTHRHIPHIHVHNTPFSYKREHWKIDSVYRRLKELYVIMNYSGVHRMCVYVYVYMTQ